MSIDALLAERARTHGDFTDFARIAQRLKAVVADELLRRPGEDAALAALPGELAREPALDAVLAEAMDMVLSKIARIVAGDALHRDHWRDIAGYARLAADRLPLGPAGEARR